ncbi:MAG: recombinase family protein [Caldilineaceae bacterium]
MPRIKRYIGKFEEQHALTTETKLPTHLPIAIYYRQSTEAQIGNVSTTIQTVDMVEYLKHRGWAEENIIMIDMDAGVSGTTKIDERPGMSKLFDLITQGKIGAVACQDEDRLFRDVTQIQVNIFIEACRSSQVLVITPSIAYDFAHAMMGNFHARQFRFKSEMAAEYINSVIKGKLQTAKRRLLTSGRWAGPPMPLGYMADMRKTLPDGSRNEHWRKYVIFEPFAEVVQEYFRLFLSYSGCTRKTVRHIKKHGPYFPDPSQCAAPEGFKTVYRLRKNDGKWCLGRTGLIGLLTNATLLGHWMVNGVIVHWNNHEAVIDEETFFRAFNYLSPVTLTGQENQHYNPMQQHARPSKDDDRPLERPLCAGLMVSEENGIWRRVGTNWVAKLQHYTYALWSSNDDAKYIWSKAAPFVDDAVSRLVHEKLLSTFDYDAWGCEVNTFAEKFEDERRIKQAQLQQLQKVMDNLVASLETISLPHLVAATQKRYEEALIEHDRLQAELATSKAESVRFDRLHTLRESFREKLNKWYEITVDERREVLHLFIHCIEATPTRGHGLYLVIKWKDDTTDEILLPRQATTGTCWLPHEVELLLSLVDSGASQYKIAKAFPHRKWEMIRGKYVAETGKPLKFKPKRIKDKETISDYLERAGKKTREPNIDSASYSEKARLCGPD